MKRLKSLTARISCIAIVISITVMSTSNVYANEYYGGYSNCTWAAWQICYETTGHQLPAWGDAGTWLSYAAAAGYTTSTVPRANSIAVWQDGGYGHVAYVTEISGDNMYIKEGGYLGGYHEGWINITAPRNYGTQYLAGFIYIGDNIGNAPRYAYISIPKDCYNIDEKVNFSFDTDISTNTNSLFIYCPDGSTLSYHNLGKNFTIGFGMGGYYEALVQAWNSVGEKCSERISWYVGAPLFAYLNTDKEEYYVGEKVKFSFNTDINTNTNSLYIYCPDGSELSYHKLGKDFTIGFENEGYYEALVQAWNCVGEKCSEKIRFRVVKLPLSPTPGPSHTHTLKTRTKCAGFQYDGEVTVYCSECGETLSSEIIYSIMTVRLSNKKYTYDGSEKRPSVIVRDRKGNIIPSSNYTVNCPYPNGTSKVGKYDIVITFKGNYADAGTEYICFKIIPKPTKIKGLESGSKKIKVKWDKITKQNSGYQVQYSSFSNFEKAKTLTIKNSKITSKTIKNLQSNKKYYVRVRTYYYKNNEEYFSKWSNKKSIKTKKW